MLKFPEINFRIILLFSGLHLLLVPMALILTRLIGAPGAFYEPWGQLFPAAIITAQCQVLRASKCILCPGRPRLVDHRKMRQGTPPW